MCYRWAALRQSIDKVNAAIITVRECVSDIKLLHHIGGVHYISITSGYKCVDLRKFYQPDSCKDGQIKPTRRCVALHLDDWAMLCQFVDNIHTAFPSLASVIPYYLSDDHNNQMGYFSCGECHPFYTELSQCLLDNSS